MKHEFVIIWVVLAIVFVISAVLASLKPATGVLPFSSYSASGNGTKAAYLLLSELGFDVARKTKSINEWGTDGYIIALGADYLADTGQDLIIENSERYTNMLIRQNAKDFIAMVFPHKENIIVFDEYGRMQYPLQAMNAVTDSKPSSVWDIMPVHLRFIFLNCCFVALCIMFFYNQRVGEAISPEGFSGRSPIEGVNAMANAMLKARAFKDCAEYYYKYQTGKDSEFDKDGEIGYSVKSVSTERGTLELFSEIDKRAKKS